MADLNISLLSVTLAQEISEIFMGGLADLGESCSIGMFELKAGRRNIVMPAVLFPADGLGAIPADTIFYNIEDLEHQPGEKQDLLRQMILRGFTVWDFSRKNLAWYEAHGLGGRVRHVPLGYTTAIDRVVRRPWEERTIDVLFYGRLSQRRFDILQRLMSTDLTVGVFTNAYGDLRNDLISRSKIVLNVPCFASFVAECPRVTFCASNQHLCVAEQPDYPLAQPWPDAVEFVPYGDFVETCLRFARDRDALLAREARAYAAMRALPIAESLRDALAALPVSAP